MHARTSAVLIAVLAGLALAPGLALAQASEPRVEEVSLRFESESNAAFSLKMTIPPELARELRAFADENLDDEVGESEAILIESMLREGWNDSSEEDRDKVDGGAITYDGERARDDGVMPRLAIDGLVGPVARDEPIDLEVQADVSWNASEDARTHTLRIPSDDNFTDAALIVEAPPGFVVASATGIGDAEMSDGDRVVRGSLPADGAAEIVFEAEEQEASGEGASESTGNNDTPAPGAVLAALAVAAAAALAARGRGRRRG